MRRRARVWTIAAVFATLVAVPQAASAASCPSVTSNYSTSISTTATLVGYWPVGETSGTSACDALGADPGTYTGTYTLGKTGAIASSTDKAVGVSGSGYVSVPDATSLHVGDTFTAEAWIKRGNVSTTYNQSIISKSSAWLVMINSANQITLRKSSAGDLTVSTQTITDTTTFHHVVVTKNGSSVHLYLDGVDVTGPVTNQTMANTTEPLYLGRSVGGSYFNGTIDEAALYSSALSADQVAAHYAAGRAAPPPDPTVDAAGDIACDPTYSAYNGGNGTSTECRQKWTSNLLTTSLAGILTLGDHQYEQDVYNNYLQVFDPTWGRFKGLIHPTIGNHEYLTAGASGYFDYFNGVGNQTGAAGSRGQGYYSYDIGAWHLISLNSNCSQVGGCGTGSPQLLWLQNDLAAHTNKCVMAYWHHPRFTAGSAGNNTAVAPFWTALYNAGADVILNGHAHDYERFALQNPSGGADSTKGIREFVVGTGGRSHQGFSTTRANAQVRNNATFGVLQLTLHSTSYDFKFVPEAGKTFTDSGSQACH